MLQIWNEGRFTMNELMETVFEQQMGLYIVHNTDVRLHQSFADYRHYCMLLRRSEQDHLHVYALLNDLWHFFYYAQDELFLEPNNSLYYTVRATVLKIFTTSDSAAKVQTWTQGKMEEAFLAAIDVTNMCIDLYKQFIYSELCQSSYYSLVTQFRSIDTKILFSDRFKVYIEHPREFTEMQAYLVKLATRNAMKHEDELQSLINDTIQRIQNMQYVKAKISY